LLELEWHDIFPYLLSISLLCSFAYAYASHANTNAYAFTEGSIVVSLLLPLYPEALWRTIPIRHWLVRREKRKESPDDDITDCKASFVHASSNKRGGFTCKQTITMDSLLF
jgi:hypothetical protein